MLTPEKREEIHKQIQALDGKLVEPALIYAAVQEVLGAIQQIDVTRVKSDLQDEDAKRALRQADALVMALSAELSWLRY